MPQRVAPLGGVTLRGARALPAIALLVRLRICRPDCPMNRILRQASSVNGVEAAG